MEFSEIKNRVGKFSISASLLWNSPDDFLLVMSKTIIINAEHLFYKDEFEYTAFSMLFDKVDEGVEPPRYSIQIMPIGNDREVIAVKQ